jgi:hypothetical protein
VAALKLGDRLVDQAGPGAGARPRPKRETFFGVPERLQLSLFAGGRPTPFFDEVLRLR